MIMKMGTVMKPIIKKQRKTLMSAKFYKMLLSGTLSMTVVSLLLMSDSIVAGRVLDSDAVAGITLVIPLYSLAAFFASIFSLGVPIIYSRQMGEFHKKEADRTFGFGLLMSLILGILLFLLALCFGDIYLRNAAPPGEILDNARKYLFWIRFNILILPLQMLIIAMVYADGDEKLSAAADLVGGVGNIIASILLSQVMGIAGISLASFLANFVSLLILLTHFIKKSNSLRFNLYFSIKLIKEVFYYSIIDAATYLFIAILTAALNAFVSARFGPKYLLMISVVTLWNEMQIIFDGVGEAVGPILGIYLGEGSKEGVTSLYRLGKKVAIAEGIIVMPALIILAPWIPQMLKFTDPALAQYAVWGIRILALSSVFSSLLFFITSYYRIIRQIKLGFMAGFIKNVLLSILFPIILGSLFGVVGIFIGLSIAAPVSYFLLYLYVICRYGKEEKLHLLSSLSFPYRSFLFHLTVKPEEIIRVQAEMVKTLTQNNIDEQTIGIVKLLVEDLYMLIYQKNGSKTVLGECSMFLRPEGVLLILRDDGILIDITENDVNADSVYSYVVSSYMEKLMQNRQYLTTMSFNRSSFLIKPDLFE